MIRCGYTVIVMSEFGDLKSAREEFFIAAVDYIGALYREGKTVEEIHGLVTFKKKWIEHYAVPVFKAGSRKTRQIEKFFDDLGLDVRAANAFISENILSFEDLEKYSANDLLKIAGFGRKSLEMLNAGLVATGRKPKII